MTTDRIKALQAAIQNVVKPPLRELGFAYDSSSRTFRRPLGECVQIVNFQAGVRASEGTFTVNLGVYHPTYRNSGFNSPAPDKPKEYDCLMAARERLSVLRPTPFTSAFKRWIHNPDSFLKWWLVTPTELWWPFSADENQISIELEKILKLLIDLGLPWLDKHTDINLLSSAYEKTLGCVTSAQPTA